MQPLLELKTQPRVCPVSLGLSKYAALSPSAKELLANPNVHLRLGAHK
jgi:hypothetical protein